MRVELELRRRLVEVCHLIYQHGLIAGADGNVSVRVGKNRVLCTPSGLHKGLIGEDDLIVTDLSGKRLAGHYQPSSEFLMHGLVYNERPEIRAVVHAHPPVTIALALANISMAQCLLSEACLTLGSVFTAPYATPTTEEVPLVLRDYVRGGNAIIMDRHGALTLGRNLAEAFQRMETLEHTAKITHAARLLGPLTPLPEEEVDKLRAVASRLGLSPLPHGCDSCNACPNGRARARTEDAVAAMISEAVVRRLAGGQN